MDVQSEKSTNSLCNPTLLPRGRSKERRPSPSKTSRPKAKSKSNSKQRQKPKLKPKHSRKSTPSQTKKVTTSKPTTTPFIRPNLPPNFPYATTAFDTCEIYVDCSEDDKDFQFKLSQSKDSVHEAVELARRARTFPVQVDATRMTIRALEYPSSSQLYTTGTGIDLTVHTLNFKNKRIGTTAVVDTQRNPVDYSKFYTEHIIEVR